MSTTSNITSPNFSDPIELGIGVHGLCYLYSVPSLRPGVEEEIPGVKGKYGREDEYGRPYIYMADGDDFTGWKIGRGVSASFVYGPRLFVCGRQGGESVPADMLRRKVKELGLREPFEEFVAWRGYSNGVPTYEEVLMAETNIGVRWYCVLDRLKRPLPDGWDHYMRAGGTSVLLYIP